MQSELFLLLQINSPFDAHIFCFLFPSFRCATRRPCSSSTWACQIWCSAVSICRWPLLSSTTGPGSTARPSARYSRWCATDFWPSPFSPSWPSRSIVTSWSATQGSIQSKSLHCPFLFPPEAKSRKIGRQICEMADAHIRLISKLAGRVDGALGIARRKYIGTLATEIRGFKNTTNKIWIFFFFKNPAEAVLTCSCT